MDDYGFIKVVVRTAGGAVPVERAIVTVKDENENLLAIFFTDESGNTPMLKVPAPPKANSEIPNSGGAAFNIYNIDTDKSGYGSVRNIGVPVFPGVTSVQPVEIVPSPEGADTRYGEGITFNESATPDL